MLLNDKPYIRTIGDYLKLISHPTDIPLFGYIQVSTVHVFPSFQSHKRKRFKKKKFYLDVPSKSISFAETKIKQMNESLAFSKSLQKTLNNAIDKMDKVNDLTKYLCDLYKNIGGVK